VERTGPYRARGAQAVAEQVLKLVLEENGQTKGFEFDLPEITIGRTNDNAVKIADALSSRHHCQVKRTPEGFVVTDLKSRNGTKLNGAPLTAEHLLRPGDRIEVGDSIVHFERRAGAPGAGTSGPKTKRREKPPASPEGEAPFADAAAPAPAGGEAPQVTLADGPKLEVTAGEGTGQVVAIAAAPFVVGRKKGLGLVVTDAEVSNEHCMIVEDAGGLHLVDLGSSNGTFVDGERLRGRTPLRRGASLRLGATLTLRVLPASAGGQGQSKRLEKKPTSDRTLTPKSDRHEKPGGSARSKAEAAAAKSDKVAKPAPDDVEEVESLDGLGGDDDDAPAKAPAKAAPPKGSKPTANLGKGDDAARAASVVADEADVADADFAARLEAAAATNDKVKAAGGAGVAVLLVAGLVVVLAGAAVLASLASGQPERDPSPDDALVDNWSFEETGPATDPVPGWVLGAGAAATTDEVRNGRRALALTVAPDAAPGARAEARTTDVRVQAGKAYRVRAGALLAPRTGVGLRVDWSSDGAAGASRSSWAVVVDPAQQGGAWRDIAGTVVAPKGASLARVVVVGLGAQDGPAGVVRVDRVHMSVEPQEPQDEGLEGPAGLVVHGDPRGVLVIARAGRELASELALCLDPADSLADQAAARVDQPLALQTDGSLLAFGAIPDPGRARVDYQLAVRPAAAGLGLQWSAGQRAAPVTLRMVLPSLDAVRPVELDGKPVGDVPPGGLELEGVNEMAWGKGAAQVSFRFSTPARLRLEPQGSGARLLLTLVPRPLATGEAGIGIDLGAASTGTREALRRLVAEAEEAAARGELARALAAWRRLQAQFPHEKALVARADREAREIAARADRLLEVAAWAAAESREVASPALLAAARSILADLERDHAGAPQVDRARREVSAVEAALSDAERRKGAARVRALVERAQALRQQGHVETARLIYQGIVEQFGKDVEGVADAAAKLAALPAPGAGK
jgi:pSer/pThr/pTyr-binding forkhead associated (FHA) protein